MGFLTDGMSELIHDENMLDKLEIRVEPVQRSDLPTLVKISHQAFAKDRHTQFKMYEKGSIDIADEMMPEDMFYKQFEMGEGKYKMIKAVDGISGGILGYTVWGFWGFDDSQNPSDVSWLLPTRFLVLRIDVYEVLKGEIRSFIPIQEEMDH